MKEFRPRHRAVWGSSPAQDITEYAVMLAVIVVLVIATVTLINKKGKSRLAPTPATSTNPK